MSPHTDSNFITEMPKCVFLNILQISKFCYWQQSHVASINNFNLRNTMTNDTLYLMTELGFITSEIGKMAFND